MNRCYRLVWNQARRLFVVASEISRRRGKAGCTSRAQRVAWLAAFPLGLLPMLGMAAAVSGAITPATGTTASPRGGQITAGSGRISQNGLTTTIDQHSQNLSLNWQSFNVGASNTVNFVQPNAQSIAVNRIADANGSVILGHLNANGQVFLINPNGVLFGQGAQVNVGGLVASTLTISDGELASGTRHFGGNASGRGSVVNQGTINAANGGYIALLGPQVTNQGTLHAPGGTVALAGGNAVTLSFDSNRLLSLQVDKSTLNALADNRQLIVADGGQVLMSAGAKDSLLASVVNNSGTIQARTVENRAGKIVLLGGMAAGTTKVAGALDASAPTGGNGGFIETSAAHVQVADGTRITTLAKAGDAGTWLIDPTDFTIAAGSGAKTSSSIGANTLSSSLGSGNVKIATAADGSENGDINVNSAVSWSANKLTLSAHGDININASLNGSGIAKLALEYGQGAAASGNTAAYHVNAPVNLVAGDNFSTKLGSNGAVVNYKVITGLGAEGSVTCTDLQGINGNLAGRYVLGDNIDASATSGWNGGAGFAPLGPDWFTGILDGLGHTISGLVINRPGTSNLGLFGLMKDSTVSNIGLLGGSVVGATFVGGLVGYNNAGTITGVYNTGTVSGSGEQVGGLVGNNEGAISQSYVTGAVSAPTRVGGLVGLNDGLISQAYATGAINGADYAGGGLVGQNAGTIDQSYATGAVSGTQYVGGLVGISYGTITSSSWATDTSGQATSAGGSGKTLADLIAAMPAGFDTTVWGNQGNRTTPYLLGNVGPVFVAGGGSTLYAPVVTLAQLQAIGSDTASLAGSYALFVNIDASATSGWNGGAGFAPIGGGSTSFSGSFDGFGHTISGLTINLPANDYVGLFGKTTALSVVQNVGLVGGSIMASASSGALAGQNGGTIRNSYSTGSVNGNSFAIGGLVGQNYGTISNSYATGSVTTAGEYAGGLVGAQHSGNQISNSYAIGQVSAGNYAGGLLGINDGGTISNGYSIGAVSGSNSGGLVGQNYLGTIINGYWNSDVKAQGIGNGTVSGAIGLTTAQMQIGASFVGFNFTSTPGATGNNWVMVDGDGSLNNAGGAAGATRPMLASEYSTTINNAHQLQLMAMDLGASYTLGQNIDAVATGIASDVWGRGSFVPVGTNLARFLGVFDGQGHIVANLTINTGLLTNRPTYPAGSGDFAGLFGITGAGSILRNVGLIGGSVTGQYAGALAGQNSGMVSNSYATSSVFGTQVGGGLVSGNIGTIDHSYATGAVSGSAAGGLVGTNYGNFADAIGMISDSYATGNVSGSDLVGGLVGTSQSAAIIQNSYATGQVTASGNDVGGLVGNNEYIVTNSYATGSVTAGGDNVGGLVGQNVGGSTSLSFSRGGAISNSYASGAVSGNDRVGGLVGANGQAGQIFAGTSRTITNSYATGAVSGNNQVGGLAGINVGDQGGYGQMGNSAAGATGAVSIISNSYATGAVTSTGDYSGGLVGLNQGGQGGSGGMADGMDGGDGGVGGAAMVLNSYASGVVTGSGHTGGLMGLSTQGGFGNAGSLFGSGIPGQGGAGGQATQTGSASLDATAMMQMSSFSNWNDATPNTIANTGGSGAVWRIYEGHTAPLLISFMTGLTLAGAPDVAVTYNGTAQSGAGISAPDGVLGAAATGTNAGFYNGYYSTQQGYDITGGNLIIGAAALSAISLDGTRAYDGTADVAAGIFTLGGLVDGEDLQLTGTGTIAGKNVGTYSVNLGSLTLADGANGLASNYTFTGGTQTATITAATLTLDGLSADDKVYDASATATATGSLHGVFGSDDVDAALSASFADKNAGTGKTVTVDGITLGGADAGNYVIAAGQTTAADIDKRAITVGATATDRIYDGTREGAVSLATTGILAGDTVAFTGTGRFADKNAGIGKTVSVSGIAASGSDAGNYSYNTTARTVADITPATLTYRADGAFFWAGQVPGGLGGAVFGLVGGDTLADATGGALTWSTPADSASPAGLYAIDGGGLTALNYLFVQASANATALRVVDGSAPIAVNNVVAGLEQDEAWRDDASATLYAPHVNIVGGGVRLP